MGKTKITIESTLDDVYNFIYENYGEFMSHAPKAEMLWNKTLRQSKTQNTSILYEYEVAGVQMWLYKSGRDDKYNYAHIIVVPFAKDKYQYIEWMPHEKKIHKYTSHFFERYRERMKVKGSIKQAVRQFYKRSRSMACVYWKNDNFVYAMDDGLILGVADQKLIMEVGCTFVDYGLLKPSQRAAFDKVSTFTDELREFQARLTASGVSNKDITEMANKKFEDICTAAEEVYSWYYEQGDLKLR